MQTADTRAAKQQSRKALPFKPAILLATVLLPQICLAASIDSAKFHQALYELHLQTIGDKQLRLVESVGQYNGSAAGDYRYRDTRYYDAASGHLLSRIIRDADRPDAIHIAEVNIYDSNGRIIRDFGSIALPTAPAFPVKTMINFHQYNKGLHSFRQFDTEGTITYESCNGLFENRKVNIALDGTDISPVATSTAEYKACFNGIDMGWSAYAIPH